MLLIKWVKLSLENKYFLKKAVVFDKIGLTNLTYIDIILKFCMIKRDLQIMGNF